ncbi:hypothetical protein [Streptomyces niveus]|uniref:hypothetical protein n=1 Tax=Streptomyces niveus TaxID=193462 RepID=UPI003438A756
MVLNSDATVVTAYRTLHRERTYAQERASVRSRVAAPRRRGQAWFQAMQRSFPFEITIGVARQFAQNEFQVEKLTRDNTDQIMSRLGNRLREVQTLLNGAQRGELSVRDSAGIQWLLTLEEGQQPTVRSLRREQSNASQ